MSLKMSHSDPSTPHSDLKPMQIIAIAAGKGGVGKSTVTVNLARALQQLGFNVGVMDADIYGPSLRKMLPEDHLPEQQGLSIIPALCSGIRMISTAYFRKQGEAAAVRAPIANKLIIQFIKNVVWGTLDYLLIDFPPGTGDIQLTLSQQANLNGAIMVTTPQEVAVMDVRKAMHLFELVKVPVIGVVENMSYYIDPQTQEKLYLFGKGGGVKLAHDSGVPFLGSIAIDPELSKTGDNGESIFAKNKEGKAGASFIALAKQLIAHLSALESPPEECVSPFNLQWKEM